jgi:ABC-2 type transport system permease protein
MSGGLAKERAAVRSRATGDRPVTTGVSDSRTSGVWRLLRAQARRDRWQLVLWILGIWLLTVGSSSAAAQEFGTAAERAALVKLATQNPALLAIRGAPNGVDLGAVLFFELFTFLAVMAGLMTTFMVVRHTRADEELGRAELIGSTPVPRAATLVSSLLLALAANILVAVAVAVGFIMAGANPDGAIVAGLATGAVGLSFAGIAAVAAQLTQTSRAANSIAGASIALAFALRAFGDATGTASADDLSVTSAWPSWVSPIGWGQQTFAFSDNNLAPLLLGPALFVVLAGFALWMRSRRDLGASLFAERAGRARASRMLRSSFGLAWRLHWPTVLAWAVGGAFLGLFAGSLGSVVADAVQGNASLTGAVRSIVPGSAGGGIQDIFVAAMLAFAGLLAAGAGVQAVMRMRSEEVGGRAEPVFATPVDRGVWLLHYLAVAAIAVIAIAVSSGLLTGLFLLASGSTADQFWGAVAAGLAQMPAAFLYVGLIAFVFAVVPRLTIPLGWGLLGVGLVIGQFGGLLRFPDWVRDASPFTHTPAVPVVPFDWSAGLALTGIGVLLAVAAFFVFRRRNLVS